MTFRNLRAFLNRWRSNVDGVAAIEFAILGPIFIALLCGVMYFGVYAFNSNRVDNAARDAARNAMLLQAPTLAEVESEVELVFDNLSVGNVTSSVSIGQRPDGGREAIIVASYVSDGVSAYLNTQGFAHAVEMRAPLRD